MNMKDNSSNMLVSESIVDELESIDAVIFDCDGVLVDITESYDTAINKTVSYILDDILQIQAENIDDILLDFSRAKIPHCIANVLSGYGYCMIFENTSIIFLFAAKYPSRKPASPNALESVRTTIRLSNCLTRLTTDESANST